MYDFIITQKELAIFSLNLAILLIAYYYFYPKFAKNNINKMALYDIAISILSILIVGGLFWGKGLEFNLIFFKANWFWFTFISFLVIELPLFAAYCKKYNIDLFTGKDLGKEYDDRWSLSEDAPKNNANSQKDKDK